MVVPTDAEDNETFEVRKKRYLILLFQIRKKLNSITARRIRSQRRKNENLIGPLILYTSAYVNQSNSLLIFSLFRLSMERHWLYSILKIDHTNKSFIFKLDMPHFPLLDKEVVVYFASWESLPWVLVASIVFSVVIRTIDVSAGATHNIGFITDPEVDSWCVSKCRSCEWRMSYGVDIVLDIKFVVVCHWANKRLLGMVLKESLILRFSPSHRGVSANNFTILSSTNDNCVSNIFTVLKEWFDSELVCGSLIKQGRPCDIFCEKSQNVRPFFILLNDLRVTEKQRSIIVRKDS